MHFFRVVVLLSALSRSRAQRTVFKGRVGIDAINQAVPVVKDTILPALSRFINDRISSAGFSSSTVDFNYPKTGKSIITGSFSAQVGKISVVDRTDNVFVDANPGNDDHSARIVSQMENLSLDLGGLTVSSILNFNPLQTGIDCGVSVAVDANIPSTFLKVYTKVDPTSSEVAIDVEDLQLSLPTFSVGDLSLFGSCVSSEVVTPYLRDMIDEPLSTLMGKFFGNLKGEVATEMTGAAGSFVDSLGIILVPMLPTLDLSFLQGRILEVVPAITSFRTDSFPVSYLETTGKLALNAALDEPSHRAGSSLSSGNTDARVLPDPDSTHMVNLNLSAEGLNSVVETAWYVIWSTLATESSSVRSALCLGQAIETDYCPFPPMVVKPRFFPGLLLTVSTVMSLNPMTNWRFEVVAKPPSLDFAADQSIRGTASGVVSVMATSLLTGHEREVLQLDAVADLSTRLPKYSSATGTFSDVSLNHLKVKIKDVDFSHLLGFLGEWMIQGPVTTAVNSAFRAVLPRVNTVINDVVGGIPIKVPDVYVTRLGFIIRSSFETILMEGVPASGHMGSYLKLKSNLRMTGHRESSRLDSLAEDHSTTVYDVDAYRLATSLPYNSGATFSTRVSNQETDESDIYVVRRTESGTIVQLVDGVWTPV